MEQSQNRETNNNINAQDRKIKQRLYIETGHKILPQYDQIRKNNNKQNTNNINNKIKNKCQSSAGNSSLFNKNNKIHKIKQSHSQPKLKQQKHITKQKVYKMDKMDRRVREQQNNSIFSQLQTQNEQQIEISMEQRLIIKVCDGVYIGGQGSIWDVDTLAANYITHLIRVQEWQQQKQQQNQQQKYSQRHRQRQNKESKRQQKFVPQLISHLHILQNYEYNMLNNNSNNGDGQTGKMLGIYNKIVQFVQHAHDQGQSCLIINSGHSTDRGCDTFRSMYECVYRPSVVACGYLMYKYGWALLKSLQFVTARLTAGHKTSQLLKQINKTVSMHRLSSISMSKQAEHATQKTTTDHNSYRAHATGSNSLTSIHSELIAHMVPQLPHSLQHPIDLSHIPLYSLNLLQSQLVNLHKRPLTYGWNYHNNGNYKNTNSNNNNKQEEIEEVEEEDDVKYEEQEMVLVNTYLNSNIGMDVSVSYHSLLNNNIKDMSKSISKSKLNSSTPNIHSLNNINNNRRSLRILKQTKIDNQNNENSTNYHNTHRAKQRHSVDTHNHILLEDQYNKDRALLHSILKHDQQKPNNTNPHAQFNNTQYNNNTQNNKQRGRHSLSAGNIQLPSNPAIKIIAQHKQNRNNMREDSKQRGKTGRKTIHIHYSQQGNIKHNSKVKTNRKTVTWCNQLIKQEPNLQQNTISSDSKQRVSNDQISQYKQNLLNKYNMHNQSQKLIHKQQKQQKPQKQQRLIQKSSKEGHHVIGPAIRNKIVVNVMGMMQGRNSQLTDRNVQRHIQKHRTLINKKSSINQSKARLPTIHDLLNNSSTLNQSLASHNNKTENNLNEQQKTQNNGTQLNRCKTMININNNDSKSQLQQYVDVDMAIVLSEGNEHTQTKLKLKKDNTKNNQSFSRKKSQNRTQTIIEEQIQLEDIQLKTQPFQQQKQNVNKENQGPTKTNSLSLNSSLKNSTLMMSKSQQIYPSLILSQSSFTSLSSLALLQSKSKKFQETLSKSKQNKYSAIVSQNKNKNYFKCKQ